MKKLAIWAALIALLVFSFWLALHAQPAYAQTIVVEPSTTPTTQPTSVVLKQNFQIDEKRILIWAAVGTAGILAFFKLIDLIIERIGHTKKLLEEQGLIKRQVQQQTAQIQQVALNTDELNRVVDQTNPQTVINPQTAAQTKAIGTGTGTGIGAGAGTGPGKTE